MTIKTQLLCLHLWIVAVSLFLLSIVTTASDALRLYNVHCASCHGHDRLGRLGPALLPDNLRRLKPQQAVQVILHGRPASQMPSFKQKLSVQQANLIVKYIYSPLKNMPDWSLAKIRNTHKVYANSLIRTTPVFKGDALNLFIVIEQGDHHASLLDGDSLQVIHRFKTRHALHGGPKYSPRGRYVYFASRDGWISKFDIYTLKMVAEIRAGINTRNLAVSADGRYVLVGNYLPHSLVLLAGEDLRPLKVINVRSRNGKSSRVSAVYTAPPRQSFIVALKDIAEIWEISYQIKQKQTKQTAVYSGLVHDYRLQEGVINKARFPIRRIILNDYLDDFFFDQSYRHVIGAARNARAAQVINLDIRRKIADLDLTGMPHLGSGISWAYKNTQVLATPDLKKAEIAIIDMKTWKVIKRIKTLGPGFFMRSHKNSAYAWTDVFFGAHKDVVHIIDKKSLRIVKTLRPAPGKVSAHVEFDRYGRYALLSIWHNAGELIIYNAKTLQEVKRIPMKKPSGKYNVFNKITSAAGTSH